MAVIMREQEQIAGCDLDLLVAVHEPGFARAVNEKMEEYDVVRARQAGRRRMQAVLRLDTPRRLELGFDIDRAIQPDGGKNVGQGVHQKNLPLSGPVLCLTQALRQPARDTEACPP